MNATDRLRQAAQTIRDTAGAAISGTGMSNSNVWAVGVRATLPPGAFAVDHVALWSPPVALAVADWLEDIAADKDSGLGSIHPRALDVTNLILGSDQ